MNFKKYSKIENSYRKKYIDYIYQNALNDGDEWIVTEKVHGSNFRMICDGNHIKCGKRSQLLSDDSNFYNWQMIYDKYKDSVNKIYDAIKQDVITLEQIIIFGELYGGIYPHPDIKDDSYSKQVQKGVYYCPQNDFIVFDIYVTFVQGSEIKGVWLKYTDVVKLCQTRGMMALEPLFMGTLEEALTFPNDFDSTIYSYHNLPKIDNNICEGVVIKTNYPRHFGNGERIIIKNKNEKFSEKKSASKNSKTSDPEISDEARSHLENLTALATENRLKNVISKVGEVTNKDFGKLLSLMTDDIMEEYLADENESFNTISKTQKSIIMKLLKREIAKIIRPNFINIIERM